jgi:glutamate/tyrosine decarboxylase-like PLP-dependent enzyme
MTEAFSKNFIDYEEYPRSAEIQNRCVSMIARMFNARECLRITVCVLGSNKVLTNFLLSNAR